MNVPTKVGRYHITGEIGRGGMGRVLRGIDPQLQREVAIKVIAPRSDVQPARLQELSQRFLREARLAARINHPGVVTVHDAGQEGDTLYLVMELVEGESLSERLSRGVHPDRKEALRIVAEAAEALTAAHALGVIHRDIKPGNIMLTQNGRVKVTDFGVAKAVGEDTDLTRTGGTVGSPAYMAPEQVMGKDLDGRADLFSLGVVLYQMLLKRKPFPSDTITTLVYQILHHDPLAEETTLRSLGDGVAALLRACLAKDPESRISDATAFAERAGALAQAETEGVEDSVVPTMALPRAPAAGVAATSSTPPPLPPHVATTTTPTIVPDGRSSDRRPLLWILPALVLGLCVIVAAIIVGNRDSQTRQAEPPAAVRQDHTPTQPLQETVSGPDTGTTAASAEEPPAATQVAAVRRVVEKPDRARSPVRAPTATPTPRPTATATATPRPTPTPTPTPPIVERYLCSRGAEFNVDPEDAEVAINGTVIGIADDWDDSGGGDVYWFQGQGTYYARFTMAGFETAWVMIVVSPSAEEEIADIDTELEKIKKKRR